MATQPTREVSGSSVRNIRVLVAGTGVTYRLSLHPSEFTVSNIRGHLAAAVPLNDQILLLGPPYKVPKDATLQQEEVLNSLRLGDMEDDPIHEEEETEYGSSTESPRFRRKLLSSSERSGARRLFLFSKQSLSESAPDPDPCHLEPMEVTLPTDAAGPSPLQLDPSRAGPLHQALAAYERQFMLYLSQGRVLADAADMRLASCRTCVKEQAVMTRALRAAVSNLSDHYSAAARTRAEFTATFSQKTAQHTRLLQGFEGILSNLAAIPLHRSLQSIARASGRTMSTLLDTVPVEKERVWAQTCQNSHQRLLTLFGDLEAAFGDIGTTQTREQEAQADLKAEQEVESLWERVETTCAQIRQRQAERAQKLTADHSKVVKLILEATDSNNDDHVQAAFGPLREISNSSQNVIPSMRQDDDAFKNHMVKLASAKTSAMKRMCQRLRDVSVAQSSIQRSLSMVGVVRDALAQQSENMVHLEHVAALPHSYRDFLAELRRRRAYGGAVTSSSTAMMERLAALREEEIRAREKFLRGPARHLMPAFFDLFCPTLATPPPLFTPQLPAMVELDTLPDVGTETTGTMAGTGAGTGAAGTTEGESSAALTDAAMVGGGGTSSASSLTAESPVPQQAATAGPDQMMLASVQNVGQDGGAVGMHQQQLAEQPQAEQPQAQDQVIVSADEQSGGIADNTLILDQGEAAVAADAQMKTLAYENAVLRQAVERLGGKSPHVYLEGAAGKGGAVATATPPSKGDASPSDNTAVISALRKELEEARAAAAQAEQALKRQKDAILKEKRQSDKISHSSFAVGDVGLFMPTGRGSGGKRTYLAFHTHCPHRYLNTDNIRGTPDFVLGRIVYQEELVAGPAGTDANPYGLHVGTQFWVLTVEVLNSQT